ncbi:MAG: hypothetical protein EOP51_34650, partial [Sphingobacteriales bacterium]
MKTINNYSLSFSSITANVIGTATFMAAPGVSNQFAYSLDGTNFTLIGSPVTTSGSGSQVPIPTIDLSSVTALQNVSSGTTVYFRYYASGQTATGGWGFSSSSSGTNGLAFTGFLIPGCTQPSSQASTITVSNINTTGLDAGFTRGNDNGTVLVLKPSAQATVTPAGGTAYTANTDWNLAGQISINNRVIANSSASPLTNVSVNGISNLAPATGYTLTAYERNATNCYNLSAAPSASFYTFSNLPLGHAASFTCSVISSSQIDLSFSTFSGLGNTAGYLVLQKAGSTPTGLPANGTSYSVGSTVGDAVVAAVITSSSATAHSLTGLNGST